MEALIFYVLGVITVASAVCVILLRRPLHNVLFMILTMIGLAGLFILLNAEFVAMVQLIVYAGAVMVLFLFVIMLLNLDQLPSAGGPKAMRWWIGIGLAVVFLALLVPIIKTFVPPAGQGALTGAGAQGLSNTEIIAKELFTTYLLPFEVASVLLLSAIIGAVVLTRKKS
jgi:NADH-quinone oxidoreductase subunit J